jgi:hypothetical protein
MKVLAVSLSWRKTVRVAHNAHRCKLPPPGPSTVNFEHQRPAQKRADHHQTGKEAQAGKSKLDCNGLHNIGSDQHFQTE